MAVLLAAIATGGNNGSSSRTTMAVTPVMKAACHLASLTVINAHMSVTPSPVPSNGRDVFDDRRPHPPPHRPCTDTPTNSCIGPPKSGRTAQGSGGYATRPGTDHGAPHQRSRRSCGAANPCPEQPLCLHARHREPRMEIHVDPWDLPCGMPGTNGSVRGAQRMVG